MTEAPSHLERIEIIKQKVLCERVVSLNEYFYKYRAGSWKMVLVNQHASLL